MNDLDLALWNKLQQAALPGNRWQAELSLAFASREDGSFLASRQHIGPLVIQKTLHPEGGSVCHGIIVHPPGGVAGGDALRLNVSVAEHAHALLTTPGAAKWYKANGVAASQHLSFVLEDSACLEWLPQENILFDGSQLALSADILLGENSVYAGWEILCFGRQAQGERWQSGHLRQTLKIKRQQHLIWQECTLLNPNHRVFSSMVGLRNNVVSGSFVIAAGQVPDELISACREISAETPAKFGVTALSQVFSARYVGASAPAARHYFEAIWHILRPWYALRKAIRPRIWST